MLTTLLRLFRAAGSTTTKESCNPVPLSTTRSTKKRDIIEGRIFVSRRALESRLPSAGHPQSITRQHATIAAERRCRKWLEQQMREGGPTKTKEQYRTEAQARFGVGPTAFKQANLGKCRSQTPRPIRWSRLTETEIEPGNRSPNRSSCLFRTERSVHPPKPFTMSRSRPGRSWLPQLGRNRMVRMSTVPR